MNTALTLPTCGATVSGRLRSPATTSTPSGTAEASPPPGTSALTFSPASTSARATAPPAFPVAPVIRITNTLPERHGTVLLHHPGRTFSGGYYSWYFVDHHGRCVAQRIAEPRDPAA